MWEKKKGYAARLNKERGRQKGRGKCHNSTKFKWNVISLIFQPFPYGGKSQHLQREMMKSLIAWLSPFLAKGTVRQGLEILIF